MSKRLLFALSAAVISAKMAGAATAPYAETALDDLENLIDANNLSAIQAYLIENAELTVGETPLALTARSILGDSSFQSEAFSFDEAWYFSRNYAQARREFRQRIRAYRKWKREHGHHY